MLQTINDDCTNISLADVDLIIADPPYGGILSDDWDKLQDYKSFTNKWLDHVKPWLKPTASIYVWCSIGPKSTSLLDIATKLKSDYIFQDMVVWSKQRGRGNRQGWLFTREEILWATIQEKGYKWNKAYSTHKYEDCWIKRLKREANPYKRATNVWTDIDEPTIEAVKNSGSKGPRKVWHTAQKPIDAIKRIILAHTNEGDLVVDPFAGSGTTAIACQNLKRRCIVIEKDPQIFQTMQERLQISK